MQGDNLIDPDEWRFFLSATSGSRVEAANPDPSWITAQIWAAVTSLAKLPAFGGFEEHLARTLTLTLTVTVTVTLTLQLTRTRTRTRTLTRTRTPASFAGTTGRWRRPFATTSGSCCASAPFEP